MSHDEIQIQETNDTFVAPGAHIGPDVVLEAGARIGANAVVGSWDPAITTPATVVQRGAVVGPNSTILPGVTIGSSARVSPGAVVDRDVPHSAIVVGNPARITGYVDTPTMPPASAPPAPGDASVGTVATGVAGVTLHTFPVVPDMRGSLTVGEFERQIPFVPARYFMVYDVPSTEVRGEHAHVECHQFLLCVKGSLTVLADDGRTREEFVIDRPNTGVYLPPLTWGIQYRYSHDAVLLAFASHPYDPDDYIREYTEFLNAVAARS